MDKTTTPPRMRTVHDAAEEIKKADPKTAIKEYRIRQLANDGVISRVMAGKKLLIDFDELIEYLKNPTAEKFSVTDTSAKLKISPIM
ncbi:MAG: DNA-binding protein [Ruminococcus sp.]|nr:DNA-binding protein [Ruminococcus sp.]